MWELFKAELRRFRVWAGAYALLHLLILGFMTRVLDLAQQPSMIYQAIGAAYALTGLLLGLYQMGGYRRPNTWLNLLHRPLPCWQVAAALCGAAAVLLLLAIAVPILATAAWQETMTARVVDGRHWQLSLAALLIASCSYVAGAYSMLGGKRYAACALVLPTLLWSSDAVGLAALAFQGLVLGWLLWMLVTAFKPDLSAPPRHALALIATALPLQLSVYLLLFVINGAFESAWTMQGSHPLNSTPRPGGAVEADRAEGKDLMLAGLANSDVPEAALWREQVALSDVFELAPQFGRLPQRNELTNIAPMEFDDEERGVRWVFSHDRMRFEGYTVADGHRSGQFGIGPDDAAFPTPPLPAGRVAALPAGDSLLLANSALYHYRSETALALPRVRLPEPEMFAAAPEIVGESIAVLSDNALYFFDGRDALESDLVLEPRLRVPLPGNYSDLSRIDLIEQVDGYLLSFIYTRNAYAGQLEPYQQVLRVDDGGHVDLIARRDLSADFPTWYRYQEWWASPAMYALRRGAKDLFAAPSPLRATSPLRVPRGIWLWTGALSLLSLLGAIWLTRRGSLSLPARLAWIAACGLIGLPALGSLWLLYPERERLAERTLAQAAAA